MSSEPTGIPGGNQPAALGQYPPAQYPPAQYPSAQYPQAQNPPVTYSQAPFSPGPYPPRAFSSGPYTSWTNPPAPQPSKMTPLRLGIGAGVVVAVVVVLALIGQAAARPTPRPTFSWPSGWPTSTRTAGPSTGPSASPRVSSPTPSQSTPNIAPVISGWKVAYSRKDAAAYDYPATSWRYSETMLSGYEADAGILVIRHAVADLRPAQCSGKAATLASIGIVTTPAKNSGDANLEAAALAEKWARARNTDSDGTVHPVPSAVTRQITSLDGVEIAVASLTFTPDVVDDYECHSPTVRFTAAVKPLGSGAFLLMVINSGQGVSGSLEQADEDKVIKSIRPA